MTYPVLSPDIPYISHSTELLAMATSRFAAHILELHILDDYMPRACRNTCCVAAFS
jgi:hypothetical protein